MGWLSIVLVTWVLGCRPQPQPAPSRTTPAAMVPRAPQSDYVLFVASEAEDKVRRIHFGPAGLRVAGEIRLGTNPAQVQGPHGLFLSPDGRFLFVSTAHGAPFGYLWKFATDRDALLGRVRLGNFPATVHVSPDGGFAYAVNFNLHGLREPSSVSVVATESMTEVARITTCAMPHGSRLNAQGTKHYSACMMDDMLVEIDVQQLKVARHFILTPGAERGALGAPTSIGARTSAPHDHAGESLPAAGATCSPTWAQPSTTGATVFVACSGTNAILEIDADRWQLIRRFPAAAGVYNLAVTPDGRRLLATNRRDQSVSVFDLASGRELAQVRTSRPVVSGVVVSPDGRYAFVTAEGVGAESGTMDVVDLETFKIVGSIEAGLMAGGIDLWRTGPG